GFASAIAPETLRLRNMMGSPEVAAFNASKIAMITHLRAVANAGRVNVQELEQVNGAIAGARNYQQLAAAVRQARRLLEIGRQNLVKSGRLNVSALTAGPPGMGGMPRGDGRTPLPTGVPRTPGIGAVSTGPSPPFPYSSMRVDPKT